MLDVKAVIANMLQCCYVGVAGNNDMSGTNSQGSFNNGSWHYKKYADGTCEINGVADIDTAAGMNGCSFYLPLTLKKVYSANINFGNTGDTNGYCCWTNCGTDTVGCWLYASFAATGSKVYIHVFGTWK